jgi:cysteinyl-tRNA synthetase
MVDSKTTPFSSWKKPQKKDDTFVTGLKVQNSLSPADLVEFVPMSGRRVTWYMCGPTVYDSSHLGHARTYISQDLIKRIMRDYFGYDLFVAMNITNIDDKIINRSNEVGEDFAKFATKWENDFFDDMKKLEVEHPDVITRVSEYVDPVIKFIEKIIERGYAYESNGSVYFNTVAYKESDHVYGKLAPSKVGDLEKLKEGEGSRNAKDHDTDKKNPYDFALWKKSKENEPKWDSPWGQGRPGWHIECSAMADAVLGNPIDIHSGGVDLQFPHHENEIAQSEAFYDNEQWINYFLHTGHLNIDGLKMAKSLKNFIKIKTMVNKYSARQIRLLFLAHKYDALMDYQPAEDEVDEAMRNDPKYKGSKGSMGQVGDIDKKYSEFFSSMKARLRINPITDDQFWTIKEFELNKLFLQKKDAIHASFLNNFNTPGVLKELEELMSATQTYVKNDKVKFPLLYAVTTYIFKIFKTMGINYEDKFNNAGDEVAPFINALSAFRDKIRPAAREKKYGDIVAQAEEIQNKIVKELQERLANTSNEAEKKQAEPYIETLIGFAQKIKNAA